jgi:hypothetical protein
VAHLLLLFLLAAETAPTADALLKKYDAIMGADNFEAVAEMTAHRDDGSVRSTRCGC